MVFKVYTSQYFDFKDKICQNLDLKVNYLVYQGQNTSKFWLQGQNVSKILIWKVKILKSIIWGFKVNKSQNLSKNWFIEVKMLIKMRIIWFSKVKNLVLKSIIWFSRSILVNILILRTKFVKKQVLKGQKLSKFRFTGKLFGFSRLTRVEISVLRSKFVKNLGFPGKLEQ